MDRTAAPQALSLERARNAVRGLMAAAPETATAQLADGAWKTIVLADAAVGMLTRVRPGDRVALDGAMVDGQSTVNQAQITGENMPVSKGPVDTVFCRNDQRTGRGLVADHRRHSAFDHWILGRTN